MRARSIRTRLVALSFAASAAAVGAATVGMLVYGWHQARVRLGEQLESVAAVVGANCTAALAFADTAAAQEALASAGRVPDVLGAVLRDRRGAVFAEYARSGGEVAPGDAAEVTVPVVLSGEVVGSVHLRAATSRIERVALRAALGGAAAAALSLAVALGLLMRLISRATRPVLELSELTQAVAARCDYTVRAGVRGEDELATLASGFNQMLETIQQRDAELDRHRRSLEAQVAARTADLAATNERLEAELVARQRLHEKLTHTQKMEAVGRLAGGVAHDFNNLLTVILTVSSALRSELPDGELRSLAGEIESAGRRATSLTRQLLAFSRKQVVRPEPIEAAETIEGLARMIGRLIGEQITVAVDVAGCSGFVHMDPAQLEQVIVNLAVNARDAMPDGGVLTLEARDVELPAAGAGGRASLPPGPYVRVRVTDTGVGMDDAVRAQIFEPFFTTKEKGKGTGLGLAMVYGAVEQSSGAIEVASAPGAGTTFTIHLPHVAAPARSCTPRAPAAAPSPSGRGERVLVVEDEPQVRATIRRFLASGGYDVVEAANGDEGLAAFLAQRDGIRLVLTDLVMPGAGGIALGSAIASLSAVPVLYMSGYSEEVASGKARIAPEAFVPKPFDRDVLLERVRGAIDGPAAAAGC